MEYPLSAREWSELSIAERVRRCRVMAREARKLAHQAADPTTPRYLKIAASWEVLADDMERRARI